MNYTDKQIIYWEYRQRARYKNGTLSEYQIKKLESSPNWYWGPDKKAILRLLKIIKRAKDRGSLPKESSKDPQESKDAKWIASKRNAKAGKGNWSWHPMLDVVARNNGCFGLFDKVDREQRAVDRLHEILERADDKGFLPKGSSKDPQERKDASWITVKRQAKRGEGNSIWYSKLDRFAMKKGYFNLFNRHMKLK
jgi:hypothetical protein